jgi:hypothetical protein
MIRAKQKSVAVTAVILFGEFFLPSITGMVTALCAMGVLQNKGTYGSKSVKLITQSVG